MNTHRPAAGQRRLVVCAWSVGLVLLVGSSIGAQSLSVSGSPSALNVTTAVAGSPPTAVSNAATTYTAKAKRATQPQKIVAHLSTSMPAGTTLTISLVALPGATSAGTVALTTADQMLVTNITNTTNKKAGITYTFSATSAAGVITPTSNTVTFTILAAP